MMNSSNSDPIYTVFVSHSRQDRELLEFIVSHMRQEGFEPVYDTKDFEFASSWRQQMDEAIETCDAMIVLMTENATQSAWVLTEVIWGLAKNKQPVILLDERVADQMPRPISHLHAAEFIVNYARDQTVDPIKTYIMNDRTMKKVFHKLEELASNSTAEEFENYEQPFQEQEGDELYCSILNTIIHKHPKPSYQHIEQTILRLKKGLQPHDLARIIELEMQRKGVELIEDQSPDDEFRRSHIEQWRWGKLHGQVSSKLESETFLNTFLAQTREFTVDESDQHRSIKVFRYPLIVGLYDQYKAQARNGHFTLQDNANLPWTPNADDLTDKSLNTLEREIRKLAGWLEEEKGIVGLTQKAGPLAGHDRAISDNVRIGHVGRQSRRIGGQVVDNAAVSRVQAQ